MLTCFSWLGMCSKFLAKSFNHQIILCSDLENRSLILPFGLSSRGKSFVSTFLVKICKCKHEWYKTTMKLRTKKPNILKI